MFGVYHFYHVFISGAGGILLGFLLGVLYLSLLRIGSREEPRRER
jgi:NhaP-type Na+/H+ or K+/H+ antiporter